MMAGKPAMRSVTSPIVVPGPNSLIPDLRYTYPPSFRRRPGPRGAAGPHSNA